MNKLKHKFKLLQERELRLDIAKGKLVHEYRKQLKGGIREVCGEVGLCLVDAQRVMKLYRESEGLV